MAISNIDNDKPNPLLHAGLFSKTFFWWLKDFIRTGKRENLTAKDLYNTLPDDFSKTLCHRLETAWTREISDASTKKTKPSLWKAFFMAFGWNFLTPFIFSISFIILTILGPYTLQNMMSYFDPNLNMTHTQAYLNASILVVLMILRAVFMQHNFFLSRRLGMQAKIACSSLIYKKMLRISASADASAGSSVISLLTLDVAKFEICLLVAPYVFIVPIQLFVTTYLIWQYVEFDVTVLSVATLIISTLPVLVIYQKIFFILRKKQTQKTDERLSLIEEVIGGIRSIKMFVWEKNFEDHIFLTRRSEIKNYLNISYIGSIVASITSICHRLCLFVVLVYKSGMPSAATILPIAQHFNNLQFSIHKFLFHGIRRIFDLRVSMKRLENFLLLEEVKSSNDKITDDNIDNSVVIDNVTASWDGQEVALEDVNLAFVPKNLCALVGAIGSGKSSILKAILGELPLSSGKVYVNGKVSYASQRPWLFPASVKDNILFGEIYDEDKYNKVVSACALLEDFTNLPYADETLVGDRGINLSGGQCARVNLARAVYRDADIYLFDNPLSAVDMYVARKLMDDCINGLLANKTRVLVTHNINLLQDDDEIIFLDHGAVKFRGMVKLFMKSCHYIENFPSGQTVTLENKFHAVESEKSTLANYSSQKSGAKETEELIAKGFVKMSVYLRLIKAGGFHALLVLLLLNIIFISSMASFDYSIIAWIQDNNSTSEMNNELVNTTYFPENITNIETASTDYISTNEKNTSLLLGGLLISILFTCMLVQVNLNKFILNASKRIHNNMLSQLMKTTLRFFEVNPSGRIINRFSEDTRIADDMLPDALSEVNQASCFAIALLASTIIVNWWIIIPGTICILFYFLIGKSYLATIQKLTRLVGTAKSSVLSFVASSLDGLATIRAFNAENFVSKDFSHRQDRQTAANFLVISVIPANGLWIELTNLMLLASIVYVCIVLKNDETYEGYVGLALMQIMNMNVIMPNMIIRIVETLSFMPNIERMLQFAHLEPEDSIQDVRLTLPNSWPDRGQVKFEELYLRYSDDSDPVLWNLNFTIEAGSKVGIVGRTGAGKTSLVAALFRLAKLDGLLLIDDVDVSEIELSKLRSKISIIPQEPFLFKATLRKNIDPHNEFEDALLWSALEDVELKALFTTLDYPIQTGGSNLSLGQRQLLCLARAILKKNKILILDEATANIDLATDAFIQKTIRCKFMDCTVITIAHRLETVMDSDKILVMENGQVVEYDHPFLLLQNNDGYFHKMLQRIDNVTAHQLKVIAEQAYRSKQTEV